MAAVTVTFPDVPGEQAEAVAAAIRAAGSLEFHVEGGDEVNVTVGDVTVES